MCTAKINSLAGTHKHMQTMRKKPIQTFYISIEYTYYSQNDDPDSVLRRMSHFNKTVFAR